MDFILPEERLRLLGLFLAILAMAVIETAGVASVLPFIALVANPELIHEHAWIERIYDLLGFGSTYHFLLFAGALVLLTIAVANGFSILTTWLMLRFVWKKHHQLSRRLLDRYLHEPYTFFLDRNTADLSKNILAEVLSVVVGVFIPGMLALAKGIVAASVLLLLVVIEPVLALMLSVMLGGTYLLLYAAIRRRQSVLGRERIEANAARFQAAGEALDGIKEIKVLGREDSFLKRFSVPSAAFSDHMAVHQIVGQVPRYLMEAVAFGGVLVIVLYLLAVQGTLGEIFPIVSLYAFAGYKLLPAFQAVFNGMTQVRFNWAALDDLHRDLFGGDPAPPARPGASGVESVRFDRAIRLTGVTYRYPGASVAALADVSMTVEKNRSIGIVGATGSGKTTLVDILLGLLQPSEGQLCVDDVEIDGGNRRSWQRRLGYVPQQIFLVDDSITHNIAFGVPEEEIDRDAVERAAVAANLHDFVCGLPAGYQTVVGERGVRLSGGQRQRIGIARALYHDPDVLVFDEATSALDGLTEEVVMQAVRDLSHRKTLVLIAHRLSTVMECDTLYLLENGRVVASGDYPTLLESSPQFRSMARSA